MNNPSRTLVRLYPIADLQYRKFEKSDVNDIPLEFIDLDAVSHRKGFSPDQKQPACHVCYRIAESDSKASRQEPQESGNGAHPLKPDSPNQNKPEKAQKIGEVLSPLVPNRVVVGSLANDPNDRIVDNKKRQDDDNGLYDV
jgi:hypothetical protein